MQQEPPVWGGVDSGGLADQPIDPLTCGSGIVIIPADATCNGHLLSAVVAASRWLWASKTRLGGRRCISARMGVPNTTSKPLQ